MARPKNAETVTSNKTTDEAAMPILTEDSQSTTSEEVLEQINSAVDELTHTNVVADKSRTNETKVNYEEEIACKSVTFGGLLWVSPKTNSHYNWDSIGSIEYIPFGELITLNNTARDFLFKPFIVIQDPRVVDYFRLLDVYKNVAQVQNLNKLFNSSLQEISSVVDMALRVNMRDIMISKVREMRRSGELNNIDIIRLLETKLCFDISEDDVTKE